MSFDNLGDRMKDFESKSKTFLTPKVPVIFRLDGKAFHTFCKDLEKPYDSGFQECMWAAATKLCEEVQGCKVAYVQSDEITLLLTDFASEKFDTWFGYQIQKMCSVSASIATGAFIMEAKNSLPKKFEAFQSSGNFPCFDSRVWNLPETEVVNSFIWRQNDATRNSISSLAQSKFSHKQLHGKNTTEMQEMLFASFGINWNDIPTPQKRGVCIVKKYFQKQTSREIVIRSEWVVDKDIPIFTKDKGYIEKFLEKGS